MAINEGLEIVISADVARAEKGIQSVSNSLKRLPAGATAAQNGLNKLSQSSNAANQSLINLGRVVQDAPFGFLGIANNLNPLLESFQRLKAETGKSSLAFKALASSLTGPAGIGIALSVVSSLLIVFGDKIFGAGKKAKDTTEEVDRLTESIGEISKDVSRVEVLISALNRENVSRKQKVAVLKELQQIAPEYFNGLNAEKATIAQINSAYDLYVANIRRSIELKVKEKELNDVVEKRLKLQEKLNFKQSEEVVINGRRVRVFNAVFDATGKVIEEQKELNNLLARESLLINQISAQKPLKISADNKIDSLKLAPKETAIDLRQGKVEFIGADNSKDAFLFALNEALKKSELQIRLENIKLDPSRLSKSVSGAVADLNKLIGKDLADLNKNINTALTDSITNLFEGLGDAISGGGIQGIVDTLGSLIQQIGKALIQYGIVKSGLDKLLGPGGIVIPGGVAIALGALAVAAGAALKSQKVKGFAQGGIVSAPTLGLIGEGAGTRNSNPEIVAPLNKLKDILGDSGGSQRVSGTLKASGSELIAVIESTERRQGRSF